MRGCHNFIEDYEEAIDILNRAEKILLNPLEKCYIKNTEGFVNIRSGNINTALRIFQDSYKNIKEINSENYKQKIEERENFILYVYSDSCKYCDKFKRVFADMLLKNNNMCYEIEYLENKDVLDEKIGEKNDFFQPARG